MTTIDIKNIWASAKDKQGISAVLSMGDISRIKQYQSKSIFKKLKITIWLNYALKIIYVLAIIGLIIISTDFQSNFILSGFFLLITIALIVYDIFMIKQVNLIEFKDESTAMKIERLHSFHQISHSVYVIVSALTNPILVTLGMLYYKFFKYASIDFEDPIDILVFVVFILISYVVGIIGNFYGSATIKQDIRDIINLGDDSESVQLLLTTSKKRKLLIIVFSSIIILIGLLLFFLILYRNIL